MAQPLTDAINALTRYANETTGASDQTLSEAVATLASGYGGGGIADEFLRYIEDIVIHTDASRSRAYLSSSWDFLTSEKGVWMLFGKAPHATGLMIILCHRNDTDKTVGWDYYMKGYGFPNFNVGGSNYNLSALDSKYFTTGNYDTDNVFSVFKLID